MFFGSSITRITEHHIRPATRVKELLAAHPDVDSIWNNTDLCDESLDNTSDTKGLVSIDVTKEPVKITTTPISIEIDNNTDVAQDSVATTTTPMSIENDDTWYDANEEYDSWHDAAETMDNYQEWLDPPTVLGDTGKTKPMNEHVEPNIPEGKHHKESLKSNISTPNTVYQFLQSMFYKIIYFMLFCTLKAITITSKTVVYVFETLSEVVTSTPIAIYNWINKPRIRYTKKHCKTSNGSGKFSHNLRTSKKSCYNEQNCKSGRHGR